MRSDVQIAAACMFIGADTTAAPIASTARTIVAMPIVIVAVPAAVPSTAPLERTGRCRACRFPIAGSSRP